MALPLQPGLSPPEIAFLCEMELVTIIPRQRLEAQQLLGGVTPALRPPHRADIPLWFALLLKRQRRASIVPPPWLHPASLKEILDTETSNAYRMAFTPTTSPPRSSEANGSHSSASPPFQHDATTTASSETLPYHFLELSHLLLASASDDIPDSETVRRLLRDLQEVRMAKVRGVIGKLDAGAGVNLSGIGALEVGEGRGFLGGVVDGLRRLGVSKEAAERERIEENGGLGGTGADGNDDDDDDMEL